MTEGDVAELRTEARERGVGTSHLSDEQLAALIEAADGDVDLAGVALAIAPRPLWVREIVGPPLDT